MKRCDRKRVALWLAGALVPEEQRACEEHLAGCAECRRLHREMRAIAGDFSAHAASLPPANRVSELHNALERRLRLEAKEVRISHGVEWVRAWVLRFAISTAIVLAVFLIGSRTQKRAPKIGQAPMVQTSLSAPSVLTAPPAPTFSSYSSASRRSLEEFDRALDAQIRATSRRPAKADAPISLSALL